VASIEKRSDNSYRIIVSTGYDSQGKKIRKQRSITLSEELTPKQAEKELQRLATLFEEEVQKGTYLDGGKLTFAEFIEIWLKDYAEANLQPKTLNRYQGLLKRIIPALGHLKLSKLQPNHLTKFYNNLRESGIRDDIKYTAMPELKKYIENNSIEIKKLASEIDITERTLKGVINGSSTAKSQDICRTLKIKHNSYFKPSKEIKPLSNLTILHYHRLISSMLTSAVQWQLILSNPAERVKPPKVEKGEAAHYDEVAIEKMFICLENEPMKYRVMVLLAIYTGLRKGEVCGLEWTDIDFENYRLRVRQTAQYVPGIGTIEKTPKNETSKRIIALPSIAANLLREYKALQNEERLKLGDNWQDHDRLFTQWNGEPIHPDTISKWFTNFIKRNNLPKLTFHGLRHSNASILIGQGVDIQTISSRLGHARVSTTTDIYSHQLRRPDEEAAEKIDSLFNKKQMKKEL
jgi:integrase